MDAPRIGRQQGFDAVRDDFALRPGLRVGLGDADLDAHPGFGLVACRVDARHGLVEGDGTVYRIRLLAEQVDEHRVAPSDQLPVGAEVAVQAQALQRPVLEAVGGRGEELAQVGVAEPVDRLHRVADREERVAAAGFPAIDQGGEQAMLAERRVLEFVDEDMPDAVVQSLGEFRGQIVESKRPVGGEGRVR